MTTTSQAPTEPNAAVAVEPCPFCGGSEITAIGNWAAPQPDGGYEDYFASCECGAEGPYKASKGEAIAAWNTRIAAENRVREGAGEDELREAIARLVYSAMRVASGQKGDTPTWVYGGNSHMQTEARSVAIDILAALNASPDSAVQREANATQELFRQYRANGRHVYEADVVDCGRVRITVDEALTPTPKPEPDAVREALEDMVRLVCGEVSGPHQVNGIMAAARAALTRTDDGA